MFTLQQQYDMTTTKTIDDRDNLVLYLTYTK